MQNGHVNSNIQILFPEKPSLAESEDNQLDADLDKNKEENENDSDIGDNFDSYLIIDQEEMDNTDRNAVHECPICTEDFPRSQMRKLKYCGHLYCKDCFTEYLHLKIVEKQVLDIPCPDPGCEETITYSEVQLTNAYNSNIYNITSHWKIHKFLNRSRNQSLSNISKNTKILVCKQH